MTLVYALGDRGTVHVDLYKSQSGDLAFRDGHYYHEKAPGLSFLALPVYLLLKPIAPEHPLVKESIRYWWPDYALTIATSGAGTALLAVMLYHSALLLGCRPWPAVLVALSYALATPAWCYATLFYSHQSTAFLLLGAFLLLARCYRAQQWGAMSLFVAGVMAGFAVITDYPAVFTAVGLLIYPVWCGCPLRRMAPFVVAAGLCAVGLMTYHYVCFGGPFQTGYPYMAHPMFDDVYSSEHPMGLIRPTWESISGILFSKHRGLIWFAPVVIMAPFGLWMLYRRGEIRLIFMIVLAFGSYFLVNASHVTWDGGASTGPRYLMPSLPFLMLAVAACVAGARPWSVRLLGVLTVMGFIVCGSCTLTRSGGRMPTYQLYKAPGAEDPLREVVLPDVLEGHMTERNLGNVLLYGQWEVRLAGNWLAALPLIDFQIVFLVILLWACRGDPNGVAHTPEQASPVF